MSSVGGIRNESGQLPLEAELTTPSAQSQIKKGLDMTSALVHPLGEGYPPFKPSVSESSVIIAPAPSSTEASGEVQVKSAGKSPLKIIARGVAILSLPVSAILTVSLIVSGCLVLGPLLYAVNVADRVLHHLEIQQNHHISARLATVTKLIVFATAPLFIRAIQLGFTLGMLALSGKINRDLIEKNVQFAVAPVLFSYREVAARAHLKATLNISKDIQEAAKNLTNFLCSENRWIINDEIINTYLVAIDSIIDFALESEDIGVVA